MARPVSDEKQRFLAKVEIVESGCHEWRAMVKKDGYGHFYFRGKCSYPAHRAAYILFKGDIPAGKCIMHTCDNRICVNPDHLMIGTTIENIQDMDKKGRRGTRSKLTFSDVETIKQMLDNRYSQEVIAKKFGVDQTTISKIKLGQTKLFKV